MAEYTSLDPLHEIIETRPNDASPFRTRAFARLFKADPMLALRDLSEGLVVNRCNQQQRQMGKDQLVLARAAKEEAEKRRTFHDLRNAPKVEEHDQPSSLEQQLFFHRAGVYFALACHYIDGALKGLSEFEKTRRGLREALSEDAEMPPLTRMEQDGENLRSEHRKLVKTYAKRAIRDYMSFLSHLDYTPGIDQKAAAEFLNQMSNIAPNHNTSNQKSSRDQLVELTDSMSKTSLVKHENHTSHKSITNPILAPPPVHPISALLSSTLLSTLSPFSPTSPPAFHESLTFHPLLPDALHSLLLCHALIQTPPAEIRRHAHNAARLVRIADGYPVFASARSPSRADWTEVLRKTDDWVGLGESWNRLCKIPVTASTASDSTGNGASQLVKRGDETAMQAEEHKESEEQRQNRLGREAVFEALADERVVDDASFERAVKARLERNKEDEERVRKGGTLYQNGKMNGTEAKKVEEQSEGNASLTGTAAERADGGRTIDGGADFIGTKRAEDIARWVREAPAFVKDGKKKKRRGKKKTTMLAEMVERNGKE